MLFFPSRPSTVIELWREFENHNLRIRAPRTRDNYSRAIRRLAETVGRQVPRLSDLTDENCSAVVRHLLDEGKSAPTANTYSKCLKALWTFANLRGYVRTRPTLRKLTEPEPDTSTWNDRELTALWRCCAMQPGWIGPVRARDWWLTLHMLAWDSAERTHTLLSIEQPWIDRDESLLRIPAEVRKGGTKRAGYRLRPCTMAQMDQIWHPQRRLLFEGLEYRSFHRAYNAILALAGLPTGRRNGLQRIRRTVATLLKKAGGDPTHFLQHSDARVTERSYLDESRLDIPGPVELLPPVEW
jgi:integrase